MYESTIIVDMAGNVKRATGLLSEMFIVSSGWLHRELF
jgi:hypothetical protein